MKKVLFSLLCLFFSIAPISYCMTPEQRALMATESFKDNCAFRQIQTIAACNGDKDAIEACILGEPYKTLDLSGLLAKWWYLLYGKDKNFIAKGLDYGFSIEELRVFNKLPSIKDVEHIGLWLDLRFFRINDLSGLMRIPQIDQVKCLSLVYNQITVVKAIAFTNLPNLKKLGLSNNRIIKVEADAFKGLAGLTDLTIANNKLTDVSQLLHGLSGIRLVTIEGNRIPKVGPDFFKGHDILEFIFLDDTHSDKFKRARFVAEVKKLCPNIQINFVNKYEDDEDGAL